MKIPGFILSVYMLLLAVFPCCLVDDCPDDKTVQTGTHQPGDRDCGNCSPFFSCEGCSFASATHEATLFDLALPGIKQVYTVFKTPFVHDIHYEFWQPPRLG